MTVIAISETWLIDDQAVMYEIEGYEMFFVNRREKKGGGVALYIDSNYRSRVVENMSLVKDKVMECVTVEIEIERSKNIIISCVYRTPGSCIETFTEELMALYDSINNKKMCFVCGDFNIDLLNPLNQNTTTEFINAMYSMSLYPSIICPSRITTHSATLIDNIFTNVIDKKK